MSLSCVRCGSPSDGSAACFTCGADLPSVARVVQGTVLADRYEVRARLGKGGMGAVFRAWDRVLEEEIALKVLLEQVAHDTDVARRFRSEIRLARKVVHRNVCRIYEYGEDKGLRFISMELIEGTDLKRVIAESGMSRPRAFAIALQIAEGLEAIHRVGVVHRDLKTSNVMLDAGGNVRLLDFGIAKALGGEATTKGATDTGHIVGTPEYMSPEQARGEKVDIRTDVYSLGVVTYELFTGRPPFRGDTPVSVILKHLHEPPPLDGPAAAGLPPALVPILARTMAKPREARFQTAGEFAAALQHAALQGPGGAVTGTGVTLPSSGGTGTETTVQQAPGATVATPRPGSTAVVAPTTDMTVALSEPPASPRRPRRALVGVALVVAGVGAAVLAGRLGPDRQESRNSSVGRGPERVVPPPPVAVPVALNALPWARVRIVSKDAGFASDCVTPCRVALVPGTYGLELENGGLTLPRREEITVGGGGGDFVFTMPSYDPEGAARSMAAASSP